MEIFQRRYTKKRKGKVHEDHRFNRQVSLNGCDAPPSPLIFKHIARTPRVY